MKKNLFYLLLFTLLLASCGTVKYTQKIEGREVSQQCHFTPMTDELAQAMSKGEVHARLVHAGIYEVCDSIYILYPNWNQSWHYMKDNGYLYMFYGGNAVMGSTIGTYAVLTSNATITDMQSVLLPVGGILIGGALVGMSAEWARSMDREILKSNYINYYEKDKSYRASFWKSSAVAH